MIYLAVPEWLAHDSDGDTRHALARVILAGGCLPVRAPYERSSLATFKFLARRIIHRTAIWPWICTGYVYARALRRRLSSLLRY